MGVAVGDYYEIGDVMFKVTHIQDGEPYGRAVLYPTSGKVIANGKPRRIYDTRRKVTQDRLNELIDR